MNKSTNDSIIISGAGPVGLILALLLHRQGKQVEVFEAVSRLAPLGVGINLLPHSVRVLHELGLESQLDKIALRTSALHYYNLHGQEIWKEARGLTAGYAFPQYSIHRGKFQIMLLEEVIKVLGSEHVHMDRALDSWTENENSISASFLSATQEVHKFTAQMLIAAEGIHSTARKKLYPKEGKPIYGGRVLWRGVSKVAAFLGGSTMFMAGHQDLKFVAYPIEKLDNNLMLVNWIAEMSMPDLTPETQDWNQEVDVSKFSAEFASWKFDWIDIPQIISAANKVFEFPLSDRNPLPKWTHGRMTLIGDAAHPMYPIGSNGASQGILDAEKLSQELSHDQSQEPMNSADIESVFLNYENERRPATSKIVLSNRKNGPEQVMQLAHERAPKGFENISDVFSHDELETIAAQYKQTAGFRIKDVK